LQDQECRDGGHGDSVKDGDSNNSFFDHLQKNRSHEVNWGKYHNWIKGETRLAND